MIFLYEIKNEITKYYFLYISSMSSKSAIQSIKRTKEYIESITLKNLLDHKGTYIKSIYEDKDKNNVKNRYNELLSSNYNNHYCCNYNKNSYIEPEPIENIEEKKSNNSEIEVYNKWMGLWNMKDTSLKIKEKTNNDLLHKSTFSIYKLHYSMEGEYAKQCYSLLNIQLDYKTDEDGVSFISPKCRDSLYRRFELYVEKDANNTSNKYINWFKVYFDTVSNQIKSYSTVL
jgi:hypothetical protein